MKEFVKRNFGEIAAAGLFVLACLVVLLVQALAPQYPPGQAQGASIQVPGGRISVAAPANCTPFFKGSELASFEYDATSLSALGLQKMRVSQEFIGYDEASGLAVVQSNFSGGGNELVVVRYLDGASLKCAKQLVSVKRGGAEVMQQAVDCNGTQGMLFESACAEGMRQVGAESVRVPAGEFASVKYFDSRANATFWVAGGIPVPVKFEAPGTSAVLTGFRAFNKTW